LGARRVECFGRWHGRLFHRGRRPCAVLRNKPIDGPVAVVLHVVKRRNVKAALLRQRLEQSRTAALFEQRADEPWNQLLALARGDDVGEKRQRLGIDKRDGAANDDQRIARRAAGGANRHPRKAQHCKDVGVIPLERDREGDDVEIAGERLRLERNQRRLRRELLLQLLFRREKHPLAHDGVVRVEELVNRLEAEIRHPDVVGIGKCQRHAKAIGVGLANVAHFLRQRRLCGFFLLPGVHGC
jgi:hypothetical protein